MMRVRTYSAAAVAAALLAIAGPVAGASAATPAATLPAASEPASFQLPPSTFVPPRVGPISVDIAPIIINGQIVNPALHVLMPGVSAPLNWTW